MVRIAEGEHPKDIREGDYFTQQGEFRVDRAGSPTLLNCLMYKMSYYRFGEMQLDFRTPPVLTEHVMLRSEIRTLNSSIWRKPLHQSTGLSGYIK